MTRLADMQAAALHLNRLPPDSFVRIGHDGDGADPGAIRCQVVMPDGVTLGSAIGSTWEEAARLAADGLSCPKLPASATETSCVFCRDPDGGIVRSRSCDECGRWADWAAAPAAAVPEAA